MIGGDTNIVFNLSKASSHAKGTSLESKLRKGRAGAEIFDESPIKTYMT